MPIWLIIVIVALLVLGIGGYFARRAQLARSRPAFERSLARVQRELAAAAAEDRGWDRERLETAARRVGAERHGTEPEELILVEVVDRPGTDEDRAIFELSVGGQRHRLVLGRRGDDWIAGDEA
jgi:hypothetical protein